MNPVVFLLCGTGAVTLSGYFLKAESLQKLKDWAGVNNVAPSQPPLQTPQASAASEERVMRSIHVITERSEVSLTRKAATLTSVALIVFIGYSYFSSNANTKKVIDKVEDTAQETQELVKECDDNNQARFEEMDERAEERTNNLSVEIRGEQRAHFEVLSKQLNCITNICLQTINALAGNLNSSEDGEIAQPNERLKAYAESAQEMSDQLFDRDTYLKAVDIHMDECRAQITGRKASKLKGVKSDLDEMMIAADSLTPGGPGDDETGNTNDQYKRKVSATDAQNKNDKTTKPKSLMDLQIVKDMKLGHVSEYYAVKYVDPMYSFVRQHEIALGGFAFVLFCMASQQYVTKRNKNKTIVV